MLSDCARIFAIWQGGLVFYGGVAGAALVGCRFARREGWSFGMFGDLFAPALALGHALRPARLLRRRLLLRQGDRRRAGRAPSRAASVAFDTLATPGTIRPGWQITPPLHPTQLYEAFGELLIFAALLVLRPRLRRQPGTLLVTYLGLYALLRFVVEIFRGDVVRGLIFASTRPASPAGCTCRPRSPSFFR